MMHGLSGFTVIERLLAKLLQDDYRVEMLAASLAGEVRGSVCSLTLRLGDPTPQTGVATVFAEIELRGSADSGRLRRWRVTRLFEEQGECPRLAIEAVLHLAGDLGIDLVRSQAHEGYRMLRDLLGEFQTVLDGMPLANDLPSAEREAAPVSGPDAFVRIRSAGDLFVGRCGLLRQQDRVEYITKAQRKLRLAVCERLSSDILPRIQRAGAEVAAEFLARHASDLTAVHRDETVRPTLSPDKTLSPIATLSPSAKTSVAGSKNSAHR